MASIIVVGPCAAGKTTLVNGLRRLGIEARAIAQEHSAIPELFRQHAEPDALVVYLTAEYRVLHARRPLSLGRPQYVAERARLAEARAAADFVLHTDGIGIEPVLTRVFAWIEGRPGPGLSRNPG